MHALCRLAPVFCRQNSGSRAAQECRRPLIAAGALLMPLYGHFTSSGPGAVLLAIRTTCISTGQCWEIC